MYPEAYIDYLVHFHGDRDYFECHEILEEYWKETKEGKESPWVGFILLAVANYHFRRGNNDGASRTLLKAINIFNEQLTTHSFGLDVKEFFRLLHERLASIQKGEVYTSFNLPIMDQEIIEECQRICRLNGFVWGLNTSCTDENIVHRHMKRDRSDVIENRQKAIDKRQIK